jgi:hypothetical protein
MNVAGDVPSADVDKSLEMLLHSSLETNGHDLNIESTKPTRTCSIDIHEIE